MATGTPVMMPGMLNSTFTPTTGVLPFTTDSESSSDVSGESDVSESPIVPTLHLTPPPSPVTHQHSRSHATSQNRSHAPFHNRSVSQRSHPQTQCRSRSSSRATSHHAPSIVYSATREDHGRDRRAPSENAEQTIPLSSSSSGSSAASSSSSSHPGSSRRSASESRHGRDSRSTSWHEYYPSGIYERYSRPETLVTQPFAPSIKRRQSRILSKVSKTLAPLTFSVCSQLTPEIAQDLHA